MIGVTARQDADTKDDMKKMAWILLIALLTGCASGGPSEQQLGYGRYIAQNKPLLESGSIKHSTYFIGLYDAALRAGAPGHVLTRLNNVVGYARQYEAGAITKDEFDQYERAIRAEGVAQQQADQSQAQFDRERQQQLGVAQMAAGLQMMQASQPQPYYAPPPQPQYQPPQRVSPNYGVLSSQRTAGQLKYCTYSNGFVATIKSYEMCPNGN